METLHSSSLFKYAFDVIIAVLELLRQPFEVLNQLAGTFSSNPFLVMILMSFITRVVDDVYSRICRSYRYLCNLLTVSIVVDMEDTVAQHILAYVAQDQLKGDLNRLRHVEGMRQADGDQTSHAFFWEDVPQPHPKLGVMPLSGSTQIVKYKGYTIQVERSSVSTGGGVSGSMRLDELAGMLHTSKEMIYIKMSGRNLKLLRQFIQEWIDVIYYQDINKLSIYNCMRIFNAEYSWKRIANKEMRSFDSVVLAKGMKEEILKDVRKFLNSREQYGMRGIPYRHAVVLHGPPGTGKTSFIKGIADKLRMNIAYISLTISMDDDGFLAMLARTPPDSIIVIEDFDRSHIARPSQLKKLKKKKDQEGEDSTEVDAAENKEKQEPNGTDDTDDNISSKASESVARITEAGLLNALDGINTPEGSLVFLTCNDITKIGNALKRPGRIDQTYYIGYADTYQVEELFWRFFGRREEVLDPAARAKNKEMSETVADFVSHVASLKQKVTTATLQKFFLEFEKEHPAAPEDPDEDEKGSKDMYAFLDHLDFKCLRDKLYVHTLFVKIQSTSQAEDDLKALAAKFSDTQKPSHGLATPPKS
ncbi:P-loop containing nucleoside triphosphate hydrolase protein [Syncephalastrum racemosum]|uniref:P-loop containing nucleoside triphosphate hydrolase protein n=1 Tax=Syncephalastrum racemosum TaxID=13706 RepID=A0A1X2HED8_SYNRA|nr:P-loop containing nucleoside triphosphate hydrolase protein [Syncephalastrum racemosum]